MRRKLIYTLASLAGVLIALILVSLMFLATEAGSRWLIYRGVSRVSTRLKVDRVQGSVLTGLSLYGIEYLVDQQHTRIEHVELSWQPIALLKQTIHFKTLYIDGITYARPSTKMSSVKNTPHIPLDISFPLAVAVEDAKLERLMFRWGNTQYNLNLVHLAGKLDRNGLRLQQLEARGERVNVNLKGHAELHQPYRFQAKLDWSARTQGGVRAQGAGDINGDINTIEFIHKLREPFYLETKGELDIKPVSPQADLSGKRRKAHEFSIAEAAYHSGGAQSHLQSKSDLYQLIFRGDFNGQNLPPTQVKVSGLGNLMSFQVEKLEANILGGVVEIKGHIVWNSEPKWEFTVNATDIDPSVHWPDWPGRLTANANLRGNFEAGIPTVLARQFTMVGYLLEEPFRAAGNLTTQDKKLIFENLKIRFGKNQLNLDGTIATDLDLSFDFHVPEPGSLWPGFRGLFLGQGSLKGTRSSPLGTIALEGNNINYGLYIVENLNADLTIDAVNTERSSGLIKLNELAVGNQVFDSISLAWGGDFKSHRARAEIVTASARAEVEFEGSCSADIWKLEVDAASFDMKDHGSWSLLNPLDLLVSHTEVEPFTACWAKNGSSVCLRGYWNGESGWKAEGDVDAPPLKLMVNLLKDLFKEENLGWGKGT